MGIKNWLVTKLGGIPHPGPGKTMTLGGAPLRYSHRVRREIAPGIRPGTWVMWNDMIGIAHPGPEEAILEVHVVDADGDTILITHQPVSALRKATQKEIPEKRRPSKDVLDHLGYKE